MTLWLLYSMWRQVTPFSVPSDTDQHQPVEIKHDDQLGVEFIGKRISERAKTARQFSAQTMRKLQVDFFFCS